MTAVWERERDCRDATPETVWPDPVTSEDLCSWLETVSAATGTPLSNGIPDGRLARETAARTFTDNVGSKRSANSGDHGTTTTRLRSSNFPVNSDPARVGVSDRMRQPSVGSIAFRRVGRDHRVQLAKQCS
jgi:hypothetical protein